ncbi:MAG: thiamine-phosphate synthase [Fimbriimonadales bacterium]|nr:MAG: thiamine-phosphate synthase [Fimbriimonadales bacterium]
MKPALPERVLMLIVPWTPQSDAESLLLRVEQALAGGVNWVMLRIRDLPPRLCVEVALEVRRLTRAAHALFSVNPYPALAEWADAEGIHLPEHHLKNPVAPDPHRLVGYSVHSVESARQAAAAGADYLLVGTLYPTASHPDKAPEGVALLRAVAQAVPLPLIGIGGITPERVGECLKSGARGVAVLSGILDAPDPAESAARYLHALRASAS